LVLAGKKDVAVTQEEVVKASIPKKVPRVGIQVGHLDAAKLPTELEKLSWNFGASAGGVNEVDVNQTVADATAAILRGKGITVDVLPATIPPSYEADAFLTLHADGNEDTTVSGYKAVGSFWDANGRSAQLASLVGDKYGATTKMELDGVITEDMTQYYAFNYNRFVHAVSPKTPAAILELGFITNASDRKIMTRQTAGISNTIASAILEFLGEE
jgi:N-acetylmuramoyl-L-alanine amidase